MSVGAESVRWEGWPACPCGCSATGLKLNRFGHIARDCACRSCVGRKARSKGQRRQSAVLKAAARAQGVTMDIAPTHEEQARLLVHYESKSGDSIPKAFRGEWLRKAIQQAESFAERQVPKRKWAIVISPSRSRQLLVMDYKQWLELVEELASV